MTPEAKYGLWVNRDRALGVQVKGFLWLFSTLVGKADSPVIDALAESPEQVERIKEVWGIS